MCFKVGVHNRKVRRRLAAGRMLKMCRPIWVIKRNEWNRINPVEDLGAKTVSGHKAVPSPVVRVEVPEKTEGSKDCVRVS